MAWGEDVAHRRIARCAAHGGVRLKLDDLDLNAVPEEVRSLRLLERLDLSDNLLESLPDWLGELEHLTELSLNVNSLTELPPWIGELPRLNYLSVYDNLLTELPESLAGHTALVRLRIGMNDLVQLPAWIGELPELRTLRLDALRLPSLPDWIKRLDKLTTLDVEGNSLTEVPSWIGAMDRLERLRLDNNHFSSLPAELRGLTGLETLNVGKNQLTELPTWISELSSLRCLIVSNNQLSTLPPSLGSMTSLRRLEVDGNSISALPEEIVNLARLTTLDVSHNELDGLPTWLSGLRRIRHLFANGCRLNEVPPWLRELRSLRRLDLSYNHISELPHWMGDLDGLQRLWVANNQLKSLPDSMARLARLVNIGFPLNKVGALPDWIGSLDQLRVINASSNGLRELPDSVARLKRLENLYLSANEFTELPDQVLKLRRLRNFSINDNRLTTISEQIAALPRLVGLWISGNHISSLPDWLQRLTALRCLFISTGDETSIPSWVRELRHLRVLGITDSPVSRLPDWLGELRRLDVLNLQSNRLSALPASVGALTRLDSLTLTGNRLAELPAEIGSLARLEYLRVDDNKLLELPSALAGMPKLRTLQIARNLLGHLPEATKLPRSLTHLWLSQNQLMELPSAVAGLPYLAALHVAENEIVTIPAWLGNLTRLTELDLSDNALNSLPRSIGALTRLRKLRLNDNSLTELPIEMALLRGLAEIRLHNNELCALPDWLLGFKDLKELTVHNNELISPPPEIVAGGTTSTLEFLAARRNGASRQWLSKMLVVGEGGVGKTSSIKNLLDLSFDPAEATTHGMRVFDYHVRHPSRPDVTMDLATWDFGGQEIYHATHQFFLTDRSLFLLLWNARLGWRQGRLRYWLDIIAARAPESPVLLVATNAPADGRPVDLPLETLQREYPKIVENVAIDNETGAGLDVLRAQIATQAAALPLMGAEWPEAWLAAANAVRAIPGTHTTPARLRSAMSTDGNLSYPRHQSYVARALHHLGDVLYDQDNPQLADTVVLRPEWVNAYICRVLDSPEVERCQGLLRRGHLDALWGDLDRGMRDYFLAMMEEYDLSYKVDGDHDTDVSLIVERLPWSAPPYQDKWGSLGAGEHEIRVIYQLNTTPPGIPTWFIARSHRFSTATHWRTGALLAQPDGRHRALIQSDIDRNVVDLAVRGPSPASFFAVLDDGLNVTLTRYPGLNIKRLVPCPCASADEKACSELYDFEDLRSRLARTPPRHEIECRKSGRDVHVPLLLLGLAPSEREELRGSLDRLTSMVKTSQAELTDVITQRLDDLGGDLQRQFLKIQYRVQAGLETACPSVFAITPLKASRVAGQTFQLSLYCEEPGAWHPLPEGLGTYAISEPAAWLRRFGPYLRELLTILKHTAPLAGPVLGVAADKLDEQIKADVDLMAAVVEQVTAVHLPMTRFTDRKDDYGRVSADPGPAERATSEADFRALQVLLERVDPDRRWGGLSRVVTPEGLTLYLCPQHAMPYQPTTRR